MLQLDRTSFDSCAVGLCALVALCGAAHAEVVTITFDDIPAPAAIGDGYLAKGVRFWRGNDDFCASTAILKQSGVPQSAWTYPCCAISGAHVMVPAEGANDDIIVEFFDSCGRRVTTSLVSVANDAQGDPSISISAFDPDGAQIGTESAIGAGTVAQVEGANIWSAKICAVSGGGLLGVDNFTFTRALAGDLNRDGDVDGADLALLLGDWGGSASDLTCDGVTDGADIAIVLGAWTG